MNMKTDKLYDLVIVGGGPAGLCAAINGASEGLQVALIDAATSLGGQAKESAAVENYPLPLGVENGVRGDVLMQGFASQAARFGTAIYGNSTAARLEVSDDGKEKVVTTSDFTEFRAKAVILSVGLQWRKLEADGIGRMPRGVYYGVPPILRSLSNKRVAVVGAANSAGQAILRLAKAGAKVSVVARSPLAKEMSQYLIERIESNESVQVLEGTTIASIETSRGSLASLNIKLPNGDVTNQPFDYMFIMIGAVPHTAWLLGRVEMTVKKFIVTGGDLPKAERAWLPCETSVPGVFAAGDVRAGQYVKRITGAVGDGISALQSCHRFCEEWRNM